MFTYHPEKTYQIGQTIVNKVSRTHDRKTATHRDIKNVVARINLVKQNIARRDLRKYSRAYMRSNENMVNIIL